MAVGIQTIATAIGSNYDAIQEGYNGFLVKKNRDWSDKLELLIINSELRTQMGNNSRATAISKYSLKANSKKYLEIFELLNTK